MTGIRLLAMYLRLSQEDRQTNEEGIEVIDESNSISGQRKLILEFIRHNPELSEYEIAEFCDDGYSGTSMDRPGMQKLLAEIKRNRIGCVIVKDMSRFSRDYIELGTYLNRIFPFMGIRFLAVNDHYDSREHEGSTIAVDTAFQTLLYDLYSKDISIKTKASLQNKCKNGEYAFGQVPFGYEKSREIKNRIVVNEKEAEIVRRIFSLAADGKSSTQIAKQLCGEGIPTVMQMRYPGRKTKDKNLTWSAGAVRGILNNRFYLGEMAYGKSVRERVGSKKSIAVPKQEWKVIRSHHDPLVTPEMFALVSSFRPGQANRRKGMRHPFVGKIFCGGCGYSMNYKEPSKHPQCAHFWCRKHAMLQIADCCTYFNASVLEENILFMLNQELMLHGEIVRQRECLEKHQKSCMEALRKRHREEKRQYRRILEDRAGLYERYRSKQITAAQYRQLTDELEEKRTSLERSIQEAEKKYEQHEKENNRCFYVKGLNQEAVNAFIRRIYVYKDKRIEIEWNFGESSMVFPATDFKNADTVI